MHRSYRAAFGLLLAAGLVLQLATLTRYPPPHCDETYYADTALTLLTQGNFGTPVHGPVYDLDKNHTIIGRLYSVGLAGFIAALGVSLASVRFYSIVGWLAAVAGTYWLGRRLYGHKTGLWAGLLFAVSFKTFFAAHLTRPEIWLTAAVVWLLGLLCPPALPDKSLTAAMPFGGRRWMVGLAGFAGALLADIHFIGSFFLVGLSLVVLYRWLYLPWREARTGERGEGRGTIRIDVVALFFLGCALGLAAWGAMHFLPDPVSAWYQWTVGHTRLGMGAGSRPPLLALLDLGPWLRGGFWSGNRGLNGLEGLSFAAGLGYAIYRRSRPDVILLLVIAGSLAAFGILFAQKLSSYRVLWTPLLWLVAVEAAWAALAGLQRRLPALRVFHLPGAQAEAAHKRGWDAGLVFVPLLALYLAGAGWVTWQFRDGRLDETASALRGLIPAGTTVLGDPIWWFEFQADHRYVGDLYLTYYASEVSPPAGAVPVAQRLTAEQVRQALQRIGAEYVIVDQRLHCLQDEDYQPFFTYRDYVAEHCVKVGEAAGGWYGQAWAVTYPLGEKSEVFRCRGAESQDDG